MNIRILKTLIYLQSQDPHISYIKENLLAKKDMKTFRLKKDIVCRIHRNDEENSAMRIYVPSVLLYPIVVYIHKHFLHPSNSQMILEFSNLYYHPQATTAIKKVVINALFVPSLLISNCRVAQSLRFKLLTSILSCPCTKSIATSLF